MQESDHGGSLIIVSGLPGSGKTTVARQLAGERSAIRVHQRDAEDPPITRDQLMDWWHSFERPSQDEIVTYNKYTYID